MNDAFSEQQGYEYYKDYSKSVEEYTHDAFRSIDNWLLTLSGGLMGLSLAVASVKPDALANADVDLLYWGWASLSASIAFALIAKGAGYLHGVWLGDRISQIASEGWSGFPARAKKLTETRVIRRALFGLNCTCFLCFFIGLFLLLLFSGTMLHSASSLPANEVLNGEHDAPTYP